MELHVLGRLPSVLEALRQHCVTTKKKIDFPPYAFRRRETGRKLNSNWSNHNSVFLPTLYHPRDLATLSVIFFLQQLQLCFQLGFFESPLSSLITQHEKPSHLNSLRGPFFYQFTFTEKKRQLGFLSVNRGDLGGSIIERMFFCSSLLFFIGLIQIWLGFSLFLSEKGESFATRRGFVLSDCSRLIDGWLDGTDEHDLYVGVYSWTALADGHIKSK